MMRSLMTLVVLLGVLSGVSLNAGTFVDSYGSTETLNGGRVGTTNEYRFSFVIDTAGGWAANSYISAVALKVTSGAFTVNSITGPSNAWTGSLNNINNSGCGGNGNGWLCSQGGQATLGSVPSKYAWLFDITLQSGSVQDVASFQVDYNIAGKTNGQLVSQSIGVPEGKVAELPLAIVGLSLWFAFRNRRKHRAV